MPDGHDTLVTATGEEWLVALADALPYEISAEEAQTWARQELEQVARQLLGANPFRRKDPSARQQQHGDQPAQQPASSTPGMDLLADLTQTPREGLENNHRAVGKALGDYVKDIGTTVAGALSGDSERKEQADQRMQEWAEVLRRHGIASPKDTQNDESGPGTHP